MAEVNETLVGQHEAESAQAQSLHPLVELTLTRIREFLREKEAVFWVFVFPVLMTFALGIAFRNTAPDRTPVAIEADAKASETATLLSRSPDITATALSPDEAAEALRSCKWASGGKSHNEATEYRFDPTRPESRTARLLVDDVLQRGKGRADVAKVGDETITEPGARYVDFLVPGLIGKILMRFAATPMRRSHYLLSFMLSRLVFLVLEVAAVLIFATIAFGFTVRGSWLSVVLITGLGGFTFSGIGLLVAARPTTIEGVSGLMNFIMLPMWLLSGTFFSSERFPHVLQPFIQALPLTALNNVLRALMNEGASLSSNWIPIAILLAWCIVSFVIALKIF